MKKTEHLTEEEHENNKQCHLKEKAEELRQKMSETEEHVSKNLNEFIGSAAENLDKAAEKMHDTAEFFRKRNMDTIKKDFTHVVKKNPGQSLAMALLTGFLLGKIIR